MEGPIGAIESLNPQEVAGWVVNAQQHRMPAIVTVSKGNILLGQILADIYRPDVKKAGHSSGYCGFRFRFNYPLGSSELRQIQVIREPDGSYIPFSKELTQPPAENLIPNCFVVGAPKCGTTSMYWYMKQHPDIFVSRIKETNFFAKDLRIADYPYIDSIEAYFGLYEEASDNSVIADTSQFHLYSRVAAKGIRDFSPNTRIVIMLRDPLSLMVSLHSQYLSTGDEDESDFLTALSLETHRLRGNSVPKTTLFPRCMAYLDIATLTPQVRRYIEVFGPDSVMTVLLDDLRMDTPRTIQQCFSFLGVGRVTGIDFSPKNVNKNIDETRVDDLARSLPENIVTTVNQDIVRLATLINRDLDSWLLQR